MPNRILREGINASESVDLLSVQAEVFYRRLMSVVDDFGRFEAHLVLLKAACFPLRVGRVREADISRWIAECEKAGLIALYTAHSKQYIQFFKTDKPRAKNSKYPSPPERICAQMRAYESRCEHMRPYSYSNSNSNSLSSSGGGTTRGEARMAERTAKILEDLAKEKL